MSILGLLGLGKASRVISSTRLAEQSYQRCVQAAKLLSNTVTENVGKYTVVFHFKYGLQKVKTTVVVKDNKKTEIEITAQGDDIWNAGAKSSINHFVETYKNLDNPAFKPIKQGISKKNTSIQVIIFLLLFGIIFYFMQIKF
jgi:hypothetical protein